MKHIVIIILFLNLSCAHSHLLSYSFAPVIEKALERGIIVLNQYYKDGVTGNYYAVVRDDITTQIILCRDIKTLPAVRSLLKNSNRNIFIHGQKIPFIYFFDTQSIQFKKTEMGYVQFGGYSITFDNELNILNEGLLF